LHATALALAIVWMGIYRVEPDRWFLIAIGLTFGIAQIAL